MGRRLLTTPTPREIAVFTLLKDGYGNKEVAEKLELTYAQVHSDIVHTKKIVGARTTLHAAIKLKELKLI